MHALLLIKQAQIITWQHVMIRVSRADFARRFLAPDTPVPSQEQLVEELATSYLQASLAAKALNREMLSVWVAKSLEEMKPRVA